MKTDPDAEHLHLLSIFHYVSAGIIALFSMFPLVHVAVGIAIVSGVFPESESDNPPPPLFGWMFIIFPSCFILLGLFMAVCVAMAGRRLRQNRSYTFCLVIAALECMFLPFGTVLGVFTIIVLMRPSVKDRFAAAPGMSSHHQMK